MYNFLGGNWNSTYLIVWLGFGVGVGMALLYINVGGYKLYQYLLAYLTPKKVYTNINREEHKKYNIRIESIIKEEL